MKILPALTCTAIRLVKDAKIQTGLSATITRIALIPDIIWILTSGNNAMKSITKNAVSTILNTMIATGTMMVAKILTGTAASGLETIVN